MKLYQNPIHVKTIPDKYIPILHTYNPDIRKKLLTINERTILDDLLYNYYWDEFTKQHPHVAGQKVLWAKRYKLHFESGHTIEVDKILYYLKIDRL